MYLKHFLIENFKMKVSVSILVLVTILGVAVGQTKPLCGCPPGTPVCGSNGLTYTSECEFNCGGPPYGVYIVHYGPCDTYPRPPSPSPVPIPIPYPPYPYPPQPQPNVVPIPIPSPYYPYAPVPIPSPSPSPRPFISPRN